MTSSVAQGPGLSRRAQLGLSHRPPQAHGCLPASSPSILQAPVRAQTELTASSLLGHHLPVFSLPLFREFTPAWSQVRNLEVSPDFPSHFLQPIVFLETCTLPQGNPAGATHPRGPCPELYFSASNCNRPLPPFNSHSSFSSCLKATVPRA